MTNYSMKRIGISTIGQPKLQDYPLPDKWKDSKILKEIQKIANNDEKVIMRMPELNLEPESNTK